MRSITRTPTQRTTTAWELDPAHSLAEFAVKHLMISTVTGRFKKLKGTIHLDEDAPEEAYVEAEIEAASVDTGAPDRDNHLRSADFFDVERHPTLAFRSTKVERVGEDAAKVTGDLTIRGVTREVVLDVAFLGQAKDPWGNRKIAFEAATTLNRKDFGLHWNAALETGGFLVGDLVKVTLQVQAAARANDSARPNPQD